MRTCEIEGCEDDVWKSMNKVKYCWVCSKSKALFDAAERGTKRNHEKRNAVYIPKVFTYADRQHIISKPYKPDIHGIPERYLVRGPISDTNRASIWD